MKSNIFVGLAYRFFNDYPIFPPLIPFKSIGALRAEVPPKEPLQRNLCSFSWSRNILDLRRRSTRDENLQLVAQHERICCVASCEWTSNKASFCISYFAPFTFRSNGPYDDGMATAVAVGTTSIILLWLFMENRLSLAKLKDILIFMKNPWGNKKVTKNDLDTCNDKSSKLR